MLISQSNFALFRKLFFFLKFYLTTEDTYDSLPELIKALHVVKNSGLPVLLGYSVPKKTKPTIYEACPGIPDKWELDRSDLELLEKLGSGQYGDVYKAKLAKSKRTAAVKTLKVGSGEKSHDVSSRSLLVAMIFFKSKVLIGE